eukprot:1578554-Pyramimonas_sp.AAC.1
MAEPAHRHHPPGLHPTCPRPPELAVSGDQDSHRASRPEPRAYAGYFSSSFCSSSRPADALPPPFPSSPARLAPTGGKAR